MSEGQRVLYTPRPDTTPEAEVAVLAHVYKFVLEAHRRRKAGDANDGENAQSGAEDERYAGGAPRPTT